MANTTMKKRRGSYRVANVVPYRCQKDRKPPNVFTHNRSELQHAWHTGESNVLSRYLVVYLRKLNCFPGSARGHLTLISLSVHLIYH